MPPCNFDVNNKQDRKEMATIMAAHIETGARSYAQFVAAAKAEFGNRLLPGQDLTNKVFKNMYSEGWDAYNRRLDSPMMQKISEIPGVNGIRRAVRQGESKLFKATAGTLRLFAPQVKSVEAGVTGYRVREAWGNAAHEFDVANAEISQYNKIIQRMPVSEQENFIDNMESGGKQSSAELDTLATMMKGRLDGLYQKALSFLPNAAEVFNEHYFPNWWDIPTPPEGQVERFAGGGNQGRPLEGSKRFLREKAFATNKEGRDAGWNWPQDATPIDFVMWKINEMNRFIAAHEVLEDLRSRGWELKVDRTRIPNGWKTLNDKISTIVKKKDDGTFKATGSVRVYPEEVADLINNHLDPGLSSNPIYRAGMTGANLLNSLQLGMSAFHAVFVSLDSTASSLSNSVKSFTDSLAAAKEGDMTRAKASAKESLRSLGATMTGPIYPTVEGHGILKEWNNPGSRPEYAPIVKAMSDAGGRANQQTIYTAGRFREAQKAFRQAFAGPDGKDLARLLGKGAYNAILAVPEVFAIPIMKMYVPRLKAGVFAQMARTELAKLGQSATVDEQREALGKVWDEVDNRLGEMVYDNLHWNQTAKQVVQALVRAPGWQLGNIRAGVGAMADTAAAVKGLLPGQKFEVTHRMVYPVALFVTVAVANSMLQAMLTGYHTGTALPPQSPEDLLYPQDGLTDENGRPHRVQTGNYLTKDWAPWVYPILQGEPRMGVNKLGEMMAHKISPVGSFADQLITNKTFMGEEIFPDELSGLSFGERMGHGAKVLARENLLPFSWRGESGKRSRLSDDWVSSALPMAGVIPAPVAMSRSLAENVMMDKLNMKYGEEPKTEKELNRAKVKSEFRLKYVRAGEDPRSLDQVEEEMSAAFDAGVINGKDLAQIRTGFTQGLTQRLFSKMGPEEAIQVYEQLMSKEEKVAVAQELFKQRAKVFTLVMTEGEKEMLAARYDRVIERDQLKPEEEETTQEAAKPDEEETPEGTQQGTQP